MKPIHLTPLLIILLTATNTINATTPTTNIETYPQWTSGTLSIYILDFPQNEATYTSNTITIRIATWGATPENPVTIQLNGETTATIENPGMYTYQWNLRGSHHLLNPMQQQNIPTNRLQHQSPTTTPTSNPTN